MGPPQRRETRGGLVDHFLALAEREADERAGALGVAAEHRGPAAPRERVAPCARGSSSRRGWWPSWPLGRPRSRPRRGRAAIGRSCGAARVPRDARLRTQRAGVAQPAHDRRSHRSFNRSQSSSDAAIAPSTLKEHRSIVGVDPDSPPRRASARTFLAQRRIDAVSSRRPDSSVGATRGSGRSTAWRRRDGRVLASRTHPRAGPRR